MATRLLSALDSADDGQLTAEVRLGRLRAQAALVRALADEVEYLSLRRDVGGLGEQLVEEAERLGRRLSEAAKAR
jgi:hypothetical protein